MKFSKRVIILMLLFLLIFTSVCLYITLKTSIEPSSLIIAVFGFCGVEAGLMSWIKNTDTKNYKKQDIKKGDRKDG